MLQLFFVLFCQSGFAQSFDQPIHIDQRRHYCAGLGLLRDRIDAHWLSEPLEGVLPHPGEFGDKRIAANFVGSPAVIGDVLGEPAEDALDALVGKRLIHLHEHGRANDISMEDDS